MKTTKILAAAITFISLSTTASSQPAMSQQSIFDQDLRTNLRLIDYSHFKLLPAHNLKYDLKLNGFAANKNNSKQEFTLNLDQKQKNSRSNESAKKVRYAH
jgi:hypothetical protein